MECLAMDGPIEEALGAYQLQVRASANAVPVTGQPLPSEQNTSTVENELMAMLGGLGTSSATAPPMVPAATNQFVTAKSAHDLDEFCSSQDS